MYIYMYIYIYIYIYILHNYRDYKLSQNFRTKFLDIYIYI